MTLDIHHCVSHPRSNHLGAGRLFLLSKSPCLVLPSILSPVDMAKRNVLPGAYALPGLTGRTAQRNRTSRSRREDDKYSIETETRNTRTKGTRANNEEDDSLSLVDDKGEFLPQQANGRLKHLTKTRPKSPARRPAGQTRRDRSRSPSRYNSCDRFSELDNNMDLKESINKQSTAQSKRNTKDSLNELCASSGSRQNNGAEREAVEDLNSSNVLTSKTDVHVSKPGLETEVGSLAAASRYTSDRTSRGSIWSTYNDKELDSEVSQREYNDFSDEDLGDILIADYVDSDDSEDDEQPLPSSPPQPDDEHTSQHKITSAGYIPSTMESNSNQFDSSDSNNVKFTPKIQNSNHYKTRSTNSNGSSLDLQNEIDSIDNSGYKPSGVLLPGQRDRHPMSTLSGNATSTSQSARRRRFKPVSFEDVEPSPKSDSLSKTGSIETSSSDFKDNIRKTFPGSSSDRRSFGSGSASSGSMDGKREIDWGLGAGPLNSSFAESTLKSGTIFDQYLKRKDGKSEEQKVEERSQQPNQLPHIFEPSIINTDINEDEIIDTMSDSCKFNNFDDSENLKLTQSGLEDSNEDDVDDVDGTFINKRDVWDDDIETTTHCFPLENCLDQNLHEKDYINTLNALFTDGQAMGYDTYLESVDTHEHTMYSPGEIPIRNDQDIDDDLDSSRGMYIPDPKWNDESDYSMQIHPGRLAEMSEDDVRNDGDDSEDVQSYGVPDDLGDHDNKYNDTESYVGSDADDSYLYKYSEMILEKDNVIQPPLLFDEDANDEEDLFEPPPMFASDDEENEEQHFEDIPPPSLLPVDMSPPKKVMPFHKIPLGDWTEEDALEWLQFVGLGHFKEQFKAHHVNGQTLKNINFQLLEEIGISAPDERELVLAEIYELDNPSEEEHFEAEIQDALETASEQDKEKILAVLTALRSPTLHRSMEHPAAQSNESGSPRDSDPGTHMSSDTTSLASSGVTASDELSRKSSTTITPGHSDLHFAMAHGQVSNKKDDTKMGIREKSKVVIEEKDHKKKNEKRKKKTKENKKEKKSGHSLSKFWESLSISHTSSKINKLFGSKKLNPAMQYLLQAGPQGILRVWPTALLEQTQYCSFMVSMSTTSDQVVRMVFDKYDMVADPLRYYLCEVGLGKGGANQVLEETDCPLTCQCRWNDPEKFRFELRCRDEGSVKMLFEMEGYEDDLDYRSIGVSSRTPCKDVMPLIVKKYDLPGTPDEYRLMEVSEDNEDDRRVVTDLVCPLKLQKAWNEPDHVFRLVRKYEPPPSTQTQRIPTPIPEEQQPLELPRANSDTSSLRGVFETDSTDHQDNTSEEAQCDVGLEVQDQLTGQQPIQENMAVRSRGQSTAVDDELKRKDDELLLKEVKIQELKQERDELLVKESELFVWRLRNEELVEREEELERIQTSLLEGGKQEEFEKEKELESLRLKCVEVVEREKEMEALQQEHRIVLDEFEKENESQVEELLLKDHEIERLYTRNNELLAKEKQLQNLQDEMKNLTRLKTELEYMQRNNENASSIKKELEMKLNDLQLENNSLRSSELKSTNKNEEIEIMTSKLEKVEIEKEELMKNLEDSRHRNISLERSAELLDSMRQENQALTAKTKDMDDMKRNIIRMTSQLRETDNMRLNQGDMDDLKLRLSICEAEKQQLQSRIEELDQHNIELRKDLLGSDRLRKENKTLRENVSALEKVHSNVESLRQEIKEGEILREKFVKLQVVEKSLIKEANVTEKAMKQKDGRIVELEKKIKVTTDAMKNMESKFQEQNQQRENLTRLLTIIKDRDPALLKTLHKSISTSGVSSSEKHAEKEEDEEWC